MDLLDRLQSKVLLDAPPTGVDGPCWRWLGTANSSGYGRISVRGRYKLAHRVAYELLPAHLEPVTQQENSRRGLRGDLTTHCHAGHAYAEHGRRRTAGHRDCLTCNRERMAAKARAEGVPRKRLIDADRASELYRSGLSVRAVGRELGFDGSVVVRALKRTGTPAR